MNSHRVLILLLLGAFYLSLPLQGQGSGDTYRHAYDQGFSDGEISGRKNRRDNEGYDYSKWPAFLLAENGFNDQIHDPEVYRVAYRRGFKDGYENGFNNPEPEVHRAPISDERPQPRAVEPRTESSGWIVPGGTKIVLRLLDPLSTEMNNQGDGFQAALAEDIELSDEAAILEGTRVYGIVSRLKRAGRIRGKAEMELQFNRIEIRPGYSLALNAEMVGLIQNPRNRAVSESETITQESGVKGDIGRIGASSGIGALIGVIAGGAGGAGKGAVVGAAGGLVGTVLTRGDDINLLTETEVIIRLVDDLSVPKEEIE